MKISKQYFHDRLVLLGLSLNSFLVFITLLFLVFRIGGGHSGYIVQYRQNLGGDAFSAGTVVQMLSFGVFSILVFSAGFSLSARMYGIHRQLAVVVQAMTTLLLVFSLIVGNALLQLS
jgi:hypothetical protein